MPFLMYRDNDSGLQPSSYPYILRRALNLYKIKPTVSLCIIRTQQTSCRFPVIDRMYKLIDLMILTFSMELIVMIALK